MYIWILLATLMVALSFFNLSPRQDKDHAINEIKAATVVNRFKAEHMAILKYMECEIVKQTNNQYWDDSGGVRTSASLPVEIKYGGKDDTAEPYLSYTKVSCYLPKGYDYSSSLKVKHFIYCLDGRPEESGERHFVACDETRDRYLVSYVQIPDKWLSHEDIAQEKHIPTPLFMGFVSKYTSSGSTYGWTDCVDGSCVLRGYSSRSGRYNRDENKTQIYEYTLLSEKSILWSEANKENNCKAHPCLFAYSRMPVADVADHCYKIMQKADNKCDNE